jgi:hypothetical protein
MRGLDRVDVVGIGLLDRSKFAAGMSFERISHLRASTYQWHCGESDAGERCVVTRRQDIKQKSWGAATHSYASDPDGMVATDSAFICFRRGSANRLAMTDPLKRTRLRIRADRAFCGRRVQAAIGPFAG